MNMDGILTNAGTININSGDLRLIQYGGYGSGPGLLINQSSGTVNFTANTYINYYNDGSGGYGPPTLVNYGTMVKSGGTGTSTINPPLNNNGTVNAQTGTIYSDGGGEGNGLFETTNGTTIAFGDGYTLDPGGLMTGAGTVAWMEAPLRSMAL